MGINSGFKGLKQLYPASSTHRRTYLYKTYYNILMIFTLNPLYDLLPHTLRLTIRMHVHLPMRATCPVYLWYQ